MSVKYILLKDNNYIHATTKNRKEKLEKDGWKFIIRVSGYNSSISYIKGE